MRFTTLFLDAICVKIAGGQWSKASFCPPGGRSYKGVTSRETYQLAKGISGTAIQWFDNYLSDRSFKVSWRGEVSKSQHLAAGVPQGSVLGPLLFSVYMESLSTFCHSETWLFISLLC